MPSWNTTGLASKETLEQHDVGALRRGRPSSGAKLGSDDEVRARARTAGRLFTGPMVAQGQPLGLFTWSGQGMVLIRAILPGKPEQTSQMSAAETLRFAIANVNFREKLKEQTIRDPLTQLSTGVTWKMRYTVKCLAQAAPARPSG